MQVYHDARSTECVKREEEVVTNGIFVRCHRP